MKKMICFLLIVLLFSTLFAFQTNAETYNAKKTTIMINSESKIFGTVKESVTCIPDPLPGATVTAVSTILGSDISYSETTDENGEYELNVEPGKYIVFARKSGYRQIHPELWYTINIEPGQQTNCSFIMRERFFFNSYSMNLESAQTVLQ